MLFSSSSSISLQVTDDVITLLTLSWPTNISALFYLNFFPFMEQLNGGKLVWDFLLIFIKIISFLFKGQVSLKSNHDWMIEICCSEKKNWLNFLQFHAASVLSCYTPKTKLRKKKVREKFDEKKSRERKNYLKKEEKQRFFTRIYALML